MAAEGARTAFSWAPRRCHRQVGCVHRSSRSSSFLKPSVAANRVTGRGRTPHRWSLVLRATCYTERVDSSNTAPLGGPFQGLAARWIDPESTVLPLRAIVWKYKSSPATSTTMNE